jgi:hypothetical protein
MAEPPPKDAMLDAIKRTYQEVFDLLIFLSDEMEMGGFPKRDGVSALRLAAGLVALTRDLS